MTAKRTAAEELGKRVLAARKYRGISQIKLAKRLKVGPDTLGRWEAGKTDKDYKRDAMIRAAVKETEMPREFFSIDFKDLPEMVKAWRRLSQPQERTGRLAEEQDADEEQHLPPDPNESPSEEPEHEEETG